MLFGSYQFLFILIIYHPKFNLIYAQHTCGYRSPEIGQLVNGITIDELPSHFRQKRDVSSNLRLLYDYQSTFTSYQHHTDLINNVLEPARNQLQSIIVPKAPTNGILRVERGCLGGAYILTNGTRGCAYGCASPTMCLDVEVPEKYLKKCLRISPSGEKNYTGNDGSGVANIDIVILVTYKPCNGQTLALAGSCFSESTLDRPILGVMNLCSDKFRAFSRKKENIKIVMHELIHALGISVDKYAFYRYNNGDPIVPRNEFGWPKTQISNDRQYFMWNDKIIKPIIRNRESVHFKYTVPFLGFVLPNVLTAARNHFNCPTLEAVDIENYGDSGSKFSHFDEYFLSNELMTAQSNDGMDCLSNMTLALLQDTGWYTVNYSKAAILDYGYQKGCILPEKGCYTYMMSRQQNSQSIEPFCNKILIGRAFGCSLFKDYFYMCSLSKFSFISQEYQYFKSLDGVKSGDAQFIAGSSPFNEYCPVYKVNADPSFVCTDEFNNNLFNNLNAVPSYFGSDSMCFITEMYDSRNRLYGASCQKYVMRESPNNVTISVGSKVFYCPSDLLNTYRLVDGSEVIIRCPDDFRTISQMSLTNRFQIMSGILILVLTDSLYIFM